MNDEKLKMEDIYNLLSTEMQVKLEELMRLPCKSNLLDLEMRADAIIRLITPEISAALNRNVHLTFEVAMNIKKYTEYRNPPTYNGNIRIFEKQD